MTTTNPPPPTPTPPPVTTDPRFRAARRLITTGRSHSGGALSLLSTLVEEVTSKYGDEAIESAAVYFEYGKALYCAGVRREQEEREIMGESDDDVKEEEEKSVVRKKAGEAAVKRAASVSQSDGDEKKPAAAAAAAEENGSKPEAGSGTATDQQDQEEEEDGADDEPSDNELALELMENAFAIFDEYCSSSSSSATDGAAAATASSSAAAASSSGGATTDDTATSESKPYVDWAKEQLPRTLGGIGDVLQSLHRPADAVDVYLTAASLREEAVKSIQSTTQDPTNTCSSVTHLKARRLCCEAYCLVAEALLSCPPGEDVVTEELSKVLVKAGEVVEYAQGYYDKAREELQETLYLMGTMAAGDSNSTSNSKSKEEQEEFRLEKENVCYCAQMLGGLGDVLAQREAEEAEEGEAEAEGSNKQEEPEAKKQKTG